MSERLTACISGSFKFKPEIDSLAEEFADYGVSVLEPTKGWLYIPSKFSPNAGEFKPLPSERGMSVREVEDRFLAAASRADFVYLYNPYHYMGTSMAFELGFLHGREKLIYRFGEFALADFDYEVESYEYWSRETVMATPAEATQKAREILL